MEERAQVLTPTEARQASPRRLNFRVLVVSMALAVVVAAMLYYAIYAYPRSAIGVPQEPPARDRARQLPRPLALHTCVRTATISRPAPLAKKTPPKKEGAKEETMKYLLLSNQHGAWHWPCSRRMRGRAGRHQDAAGPSAGNDARAHQPGRRDGADDDGGRARTARGLVRRTAATGRTRPRRCTPRRTASASAVPTMKSAENKDDQKKSKTYYYGEDNGSSRPSRAELRSSAEKRGRLEWDRRRSAPVLFRIGATAQMAAQEA